jgi:hypothetical protein
MCFTLRLHTSAAPPRVGLTQALAAMKNLLLLLLLLLPVEAWSCSCGGTISIRKTIATHPVLVEASLVSLEEIELPTYGRGVRSATLRVRKILKGPIHTESIVLEFQPCGATLSIDDLEFGHIYVLPLQTSENGHYELAGCSHSGMELVNDDLYTFEHLRNSQGKYERHLTFYKHYSRFLSAYRKSITHPSHAEDPSYPSGE